MLAVLLALSGLTSARAGADTTGPITFDNLSFVAGPVASQSGWVQGGVMDAEIAASSVAGATPASSPALRISNAGATADSYLYSSRSRDEAGEPSAWSGGFSSGSRRNTFETSWTFQSADPTAPQSTALLVMADRGDGQAMSQIEIDDTADPFLGLYVSFRAFRDNQLDLRGFEEIPVAYDLDRSLPHTVRQTITFIPGANNDLVEVCVDTTMCRTDRSWEDYWREGGEAPRTVDSLRFRSAASSLHHEGSIMDPTIFFGDGSASAVAGNGLFIDDLTISTFNSTVPGLPTLSLDHPSVREGNTSTNRLKYTATLSKPASSTVTATYAVAEGFGDHVAESPADFTAKTGILTFHPGETSKSFYVKVRGDREPEPHEWLHAQFTSASSNVDYQRSYSAGNIIDNDGARITVGDVKVFEGDAGTVQASFNVRLDRPVDGAVRVGFRTYGGTAKSPSDFLARGKLFSSETNFIEFAAGETVKPVVVNVVGDGVKEPNESFSLRLRNDVSWGAYIGDSTATGTIRNDD